MKTKILTLCTIVVLFAACGNKSYKKNSSKNEPPIANAGAEASSDAEAKAAYAPENHRTVIKHGDIAIETNHFDNYMQSLTNFVKANNGQINGYEITNEKYEEKEISFSTDSLYKIYSITPHATLQIQVPVSLKDSMVNTIMHMNGTVIKLSLQNDDQTETYQIASQTGTALQNVDKHNNINTVEDRINANVTSNEIKYKTKYFWVDVNIQGETHNIKEAIAKKESYDSPFWLRIWDALKTGIYFFQEILIGLVSIWPAICVAFTAIWLIKRRKKLANYFTKNTNK